MIFTSVCGIGRPIVVALSSGVSSKRVIVTSGEHSVVPYTMQKRTPKRRLDPPHELGGHEAAARHRRPQRRQVAPCDVGMLQQRDLHRGDTERARCRPFAFEELEHEPGSNASTGTCTARACSVPSTPMHAAGGVEHRHRVHVHVARPISASLAYKRALSVSDPWRSNAPFGKPVVPDVYWICAGSSGRPSGSAARPAPTPGTRPTPRTRRPRAAARGRRAPRRATRASGSRATRGRETRRRARLTEHVRQLVTLVRRVDGDEHDARERGAELEQHPLGQIRRPDRDPLAGREAGGSARATCSASASTSAKVQRPRWAGSGTPPTMAGLSGPAAAAARSTPPTVVSRTGTEVSAGQYDVATVVIAPSRVVHPIFAREHSAKPGSGQMHSSPGSSSCPDLLLTGSMSCRTARD